MTMEMRLGDGRTDGRTNSAYADDKFLVFVEEAETCVSGGCALGHTGRQTLWCCSSDP